MVMAADVKDRKSLRAWLETKSRQGRVLIAFRAAARVMPIWAEFSEIEAAGNRDLTPLPILRSLLTTRVAAFAPTRVVRDAITNAANAANAANATTNAAVNAANAAFAANAASATNAANAANAAANAANAANVDLWRTIRLDCVLLESGWPVQDPPLWSKPNEITNLWPAIRVKWTASGSPYAFWARWYDSLLNSAKHPFIPVETLTQISKVPEKEWTRGETGEDSAQNIARIIDAMRLPQAITATPNAEILEVNPGTDLIRSRPVTAIRQNFLQDSLARMQDAAEIFGDLAKGNNPYGGLALELKTLESAIERYPDRPQRLHDVALQVVRRVEVREVNGDCPEAAKDPLVSSFKAELIGAADDIRRQDEEVQKVVDARVNDRLTNARPEDAAVLVETAPELAQMTEGDLLQELKEDAHTAADPNADPVVRRNALFRFASRAFRIVALRYPKARQILKETAAVAKDVGTVVGVAVGIPAGFWTLISYLLSLF